MQRSVRSTPRTQSSRTYTSPTESLTMIASRWKASIGWSGFSMRPAASTSLLGRLASGFPRYCASALHVRIRLSEPSPPSSPYLLDIHVVSQFELPPNVLKWMAALFKIHLEKAAAGGDEDEENESGGGLATD